jgi:ribosomal protein S18 acetylase RimI-like enzyme
MEFTIEHRMPTVREFQELRSCTGWSPLSDAVVEKALKNSLYGVCVAVNNTVIGSGRVIGDGAAYFYIQDVIVLPEFRKMGAANLIMSHIEDYLEKVAAENAFIGLMAAIGTYGFYQKYGYQPRSENAPGMFKKIRQKSV